MWASSLWLAVPLVEHAAHDLSDDLGQAPAQAIELALESIELPLQTVDLALDAIELLLDPIEAGFDRRQIVAIAAGLLEDMAGDQLLAFNLALERSELVPGDFARHPYRTPLSSGQSYHRRRNLPGLRWRAGEGPGATFCLRVSCR